MKIDENCINHNVARLAAELTEELYEYSDDDKMVALVLGEIRGISTLATELKGVLKLNP